MAKTMLAFIAAPEREESASLVGRRGSRDVAKMTALCHPSFVVRVYARFAATLPGQAMARAEGAGLVSGSTTAVSGDELNETDIRQRLAAILAADAAGYSRLMADDERATVAALDAARGVFRAEIESHHGRVIDMAGDSVLAVFPTATGALQAALAAQRALTAQAATVSAERRMAFRIGVHLGDVMEKADGSSTATASTSRHASRGWPSPAG
jgi:class 3 adenylate cyclase